MQGEIALSLIGTASALLAGPEKVDGFVDPSLPGLFGLGAGDEVDVVPLQTVGQVIEERAGTFIGLKRSGEVVGGSTERGLSATVRLTWIGSPPLRPVSLRTAALTLIMYLPPMMRTVVCIRSR